jgi:hypothetical protein
MLIIMKKGWMLILSLFVYLVGYAQTTPGNAVRSMQSVRKINHDLPESRWSDTDLL